MANKNITIQVGTNVDLTEVKDLESLLQRVGNTQVNIDVKDQELIEAENHLKELKGWAEGADIDLDVEIAEAEAKVNELKAKMGQVDDEPIKPQVDNIASMEAIEQISQGFDRLRSGASELGQQMGTLLDSAGRQETNKAFLEHAVGAEKASKATEEINNAVQKLPGDDTVMQGLLSQAVAKDASLTADQLERMGTASADYFSAMAYYGKPASEAFQDMNNYLLAGNTAELERSPILANHIDKLKEATTVQERSVALQEALNQEGWGGMSQQDTYNNKLEIFNGMLERGRYNLGGMFQEGAKGGMDFLVNLDNATGGLVGMSIAMIEMASPMTDMVMGFSQMAMGMNAIKDLGFISFLKNLRVAQALSTVATKLGTIANWEMVASLLANPITWVVIALIALAGALIWAYQNVDWFRQMVDNAWASIQQLAGTIWDSLTGAIQWISGLFSNFTSQLGLNTNDWIQSIIGFILFIPTLPIQLGIALTNAIAKTLGFGNNFVQKMTSAGANAVNGFINYIKQVPSMVYQEFQRTLQLVNDFINDIPNRVWDMGVAIIDALKSALGIGSPGHMFYMVEGEFNRIDDLTKKTSFDTASIGQGMVDGFNPNLQTGNAEFNGASGNNITINIDNVDSEDRIQQVVQAVEDALKFDNIKAGRSV